MIIAVCLAATALKGKLAFCYIFKCIVDLYTEICMQNVYIMYTECIQNCNWCIQNVIDAMAIVDMYIRRYIELFVRIFLVVLIVFCKCEDRFERQ